MKKVFLLVSLFLTASIMSNAQDKPTNPTWKKASVYGLNFNNTNLSTYWNGGGNSATSINGLIGLTAVYAKGKNLWQNSGDFGLGFTRIGKLKAENKNPYLKTDDRIILISNYSRQLTEGSNWSPVAAGFDFRTQFIEGINGDNIRISNFLAPGFLLVSVGSKWTSTDKTLTLGIAPITGKMTFVIDDSLSNAGAFGVDPGSQFRSQFGNLFSAAYAKNLTPNIGFKSNLNLFTDYATLDRTDINWDATLAMKITKYITTTLSVLYLYDDDVRFNIIDDNSMPIPGKFGPRGQFSNVFNVGVVYKIQNYSDPK